MEPVKFSLLITTRNRLEELKVTLEKISPLLARPDVECLVYDDGSADGTSGFLIGCGLPLQTFRNEISKGLIYCRNRMLEKASGEFAVSIDDDLNFLSEDPLEKIAAHFETHPGCAVVSFRIFWSRKEPAFTHTSEKAHRVSSFAGGAHAMRLSAWREVPDYPEWFVFHGEESFAAVSFFKHGFEVHYLPEVLTHHRVDMKARKKQPDHIRRQRYSLRSGWFLFFLFLPKRRIPKRMASSIELQLKQALKKRSFTILRTLLLATGDLVLAMPKIIRQANRLRISEHNAIRALPHVRIYWRPEEEPDAP